ncbi:hypothetical protein V8F20_005901 [Naviculisporaceae sp. PSN 640]
MLSSAYILILFMSGFSWRLRAAGFVLFSGCSFIFHLVGEQWLYIYISLVPILYKISPLRSLAGRSFQNAVDTLFSSKVAVT